MNPIQIPAEWDDNGILMFEEVCQLTHTPQRTVRDWRPWPAMVALQRHRTPLHDRRRDPPLPGRRPATPG